MEKIILILMFAILLSGCVKEKEISPLEACLEDANSNSIIDMGEKAKTEEVTSDFIDRGLDSYEQKEKECLRKYRK